MKNWKQFTFFVILVIACYQLLYFLSDMFLLDYINKYSWNLNFIQGTLNFFSIYLPYVFVSRIFRNTNQEKEYKNDWTSTSWIEAGFRGAVTDNIAGNTTKGGPTWGDFVAIPAAAATVHFLPKNAFGTVGASAVYNVTRDWVNDAVNAPPYNGRPIFEIEYGSTAPATKADKSGNGYTDGTNYCWYFSLFRRPLKERTDTAFHLEQFANPNATPLSDNVRLRLNANNLDTLEKSTLLDILSGNLPPESGKVMINGHDIYSLPPRFIRNLSAMVKDDVL